MDELKVMSSCVEALEHLADEERVRVINYLGDRFGASLATVRINNDSVRGSEPSNISLGELLSLVDAKTDSDRALASAFWLDANGEKELTSQSINGALKDTGFPITNITRALSSLQDQKPAPIVQVRKSGSSQQARKTFKLTEYGTKYVGGLIDA